MDPMKLAKQMIDFNKSSFDNSFDAMIMMQEQTEKMVNSMIEQASWMPKEGKTVVGEWMSAYQKGRVEFKKTIDDSFKKVETYFADACQKNTNV